MRVFALVDVSVVEFGVSVELYVRREDAERTLVELLRDEPQLGVGCSGSRRSNSAS